MKNKLSKILAIALSLVMLITLIGCNCSGTDPVDPPDIPPEKEYATLTFVSNGGSEIAPLTKEVGQPLEQAQITPTKAFYTFDGWYDGEYKVKYPLSAMPQEDMTVYARWTAKQAFTVDFVCNGGSQVERFVGSIGETVTRPADPTRQHYTFAGWYLNENLEGSAFNFASTPSSSITLHAKWVLNEDMVLVTFVGNGEIMAVVPTKKQERLSPPDLFDKDTLFTAWFTDQGLLNEYDFVDTIVSSDITLYTLYESKGLNYSNNEIISYSGNSTTVIIQNKTGILYVAAGAFRGNTTIKKVILPSGITQIRAGAFAGCTNLEEIIMPGVVTIRTGAFLGAIRLSKVEFPSTLTTIGTYAFCDTRLEQADLFATNIKTIDVGVFKNATNLRSVSFPTALTTINDEAFYGCESIETFEIPASVTSIGEKAFARCSSLKSIVVDSNNNSYTIDNGNLFTKDLKKLLLYIKGDKTENQLLFSEQMPLEEISADAFFGADNLTLLAIHKEVTLQMGALTGLNNLQTLILYNLKDVPNIPYLFGAASPLDNAHGTYTPTSLEYIEFHTLTAVPDYCFYGLKGLKEADVNILGGFTHIGNYAFAYSGITTFHIGSALQTMGINVFVECLLGEITVDPANQIFTSSGGGLYSVVEGVKTLHKAFSTWESIVVAEDTNVIDHYAFFACNNLKNLTVPFIGETAAINANSFISYIFGSPSTELSALYMPPLDTLTISKPLVSIPFQAFYRTNIKLFDLTASENTLRSYGTESFAYNTIMEGFITDSEVVVFYNPHNNINTIGDYAFAYCYLGGGEQTLVLSSGITQIGTGAFAYNSFCGLDASNATGITSIPDFMMYVNPHIIGAREGLIDEAGNPITPKQTTIALSNTITRIGGYAFTNYDYSPQYAADSLNGDLQLIFPNGSVLKSFEIVDSLISSRSFAMSGLNRLELPATVENIGVYCFSYCPLLEFSIAEGSVLKTIGMFGFANTLLPEVINLPATLTTLSTSTFGATKDSVYYPEIRHNNLVELRIGTAEEGSALTSMWHAPFTNCINLRRLYIYKNVTESEYTMTTASGGGTALTSPNGVPRFYWPNNASSHTLGANLSADLIIYVPASALVHYQAFAEWVNYNLQPIQY